MIETEVSTCVGLTSASRGYLLWLVQAIRGSCHDVAGDLCQVELPQESGDESAEARRLTLAALVFDGPPPMPVDHPWLLRLAQLAHAQGPLQARVAQQPQHWHEIEGQLLAPYEIEGGEKSVVRCTLDERPLLQLTFARPTVDGGTEFEVAHFDEDGRSLEEALPRQLGLDELQLQEQPPVRRLSQELVLDWISSSAESLESEATNCQLLAATIVWCKYATGKIALTVNGRTAEVAFQGWAKLFADGVMRPPPFVCGATGLSSYAVAVTDAGTLTAAEAIAVCEHSGARVLCNELQQCAETGARVLGRYLLLCPITGQYAVPSAFGQCVCCQQRARNVVLEAGVCQACRSLETVRKSDPRLARLLGQYPRLDRWRHWRLAETGTAYVLMAHSWFKRLLIVAQKTNLAPLRVAVAKRRGDWQDAGSEEQSQILGEE